MVIINYLKKLLIVTIVVFSFSTLKSFAYIEIKVSDMNYNPMPLVVFNFMSDKKSSWISNTINSKLNFDLQNSGVFSIFNEDAPNTLSYISDITATKNLLSNYMDFNALVIGKVIHDKGFYRVSYIVWDVYNDKPLLAKGFKLSKPTEQDINYLSHYISNSIYKAFVGEDGYFNSKIAFVHNKRVYIMDYDGENKQTITDGTTEVYTPIFSKDNKYLAYITLNKGVSEIYVYDLENKINYKLGNFDSLVLAPRFSNDSKYMLFSIAKGGSTNIFQLNIGTKVLTQLTYSASINIPGGYSPDNKYIAFTSDRRGSPQIYLMKKDGTSVRRISSLKGVYYTPKWSSRGDLIAFTKVLKGGRFSIGVMDPNGDNEKIIANDYFAEGPSWTANGRNLIYQFVYDSYNRKYAFCLVSLSSGYKLTLKPFDNVKDPSFSSNFINNNIINSEYELMEEKHLFFPLEHSISNSSNKGLNSNTNK